MNDSIEEIVQTGDAMVPKRPEPNHYHLRDNKSLRSWAKPLQRGSLWESVFAPQTLGCGELPLFTWDGAEVYVARAKNEPVFVQKSEIITPIVEFGEETTIKHWHAVNNKDTAVSTHILKCIAKINTDLDKQTLLLLGNACWRMPRLAVANTDKIPHSIRAALAMLKDVESGYQVIVGKAVGDLFQWGHFSDAEEFQPNPDEVQNSIHCNTVGTWLGHPIFQIDEGAGNDTSIYVVTANAGLTMVRDDITVVPTALSQDLKLAVFCSVGQAAFAGSVVSIVVEALITPTDISESPRAA